jgi:hypothetical protein
LNVPTRIKFVISLSQVVLKHPHEKEIMIEVAEEPQGAQNVVDDINEFLAVNRFPLFGAMDRSNFSE